MQGPSDLGFHLEMVQECSACHEDYAETYVGTYHGKATELGYDLAATCSDCHGAHGILPTSHAGSAVAPDNLVETCGDCHENARPAFVLYDSHPDPMDGERNAALHYSFVFMNVLLVGVMGVFTLHTALWWVRLLLDKRKGIIHGIGEDHG
jgi:NAD-dependent SIR2 family protein deacetylase